MTRAAAVAVAARSDGRHHCAIVRTGHRTTGIFDLRRQLRRSFPNKNAPLRTTGGGGGVDGSCCVRLVPHAVRHDHL